LIGAYGMLICLAGVCKGHPAILITGICIGGVGWVLGVYFLILSFSALARVEAIRV
jgi:hypothetical protein